MQQVIHLKKFPLKTLALAGLMALGSNAVWAAYLSCTAVNPVVNFGTIDDVLSGTTPTTSGTITISCTKSSPNLGSVSRICINLGEGSGSALLGSGTGTSRITPRIANGTVITTNGVGFQLYQDNAAGPIWGSGSSGTDIYTPKDFPRVSHGSQNFTRTESATIFAKIETLATAINGTTSLATIIPGTYTSSFADPHSLVQATVVTTGGNISNRCEPQSGYPNYGTTFPLNFAVQMTIAPQCKIKGTIADIDFGTQAATATSLQASTALTVQCTRTTPYAIGLLPSAANGGNSSGGGNMKNAGGDLVAYQLRQAAGMSGAVWGNTTAIAPGLAGNGVQGTGTGSDQNHTIYATVASADAPAGSYQDLVTVTVNY